jgi:endoglucanase
MRRGGEARVGAAALLCIAGCGSAAAGPPPASPGLLDGGDVDGTLAVDASDPPADAGASDSGGGSPLHVEGNHLVKNGSTVRLLGVDHSGTEYACIGGYAFVEGPDDDTLTTAMKTWHVNAVRIPLNEDCWLGINGVKAAYSGQAYETAIKNYVALFHAYDIFTVVDLHWNAPGTSQATTQEPMADADHAVAFWSSVAAAFKDDPDTIFDLYNEPYVDATNAQTSDPWACWRDGCTITQSLGSVQGSWQSAGMQALLDAVRGAGATNVVMLGGLAYANDLTGWLSHQPKDPLGQTAASFHNYNFNTCSDQACWTSQILPVANAVPLVTGELGENDCAHGYIDGYMPWADTHGISYLGWAWNTFDCKSGPALITNYSGAPTSFGAGLMAHLVSVNP